MRMVGAMSLPQARMTLVNRTVSCPYICTFESLPTSTSAEKTYPWEGTEGEGAITNVNFLISLINL